MRLFIYVLFSLFIFITAARAQNCTNPDGDLGVLRFNIDYGVLQLCTVQNWVALHSVTCPAGDGCGCTLDGVTVAHNEAATFYSAEEDPDCASISQERTCSNGTLDGSASYQYAACDVPPPGPCEGSPSPGTLCDDGSIYAGTTVGGAKMYVPDEDQGIWIAWKTSYGDDDIEPDSETDGQANHDNRSGNLSNFPAFEACETLDRHDHQDWYLPAKDELRVLYQNQDDIDASAAENFRENFYWSSTEINPGGAWAKYFSSSGTETDHLKIGGNLFVRCVRRD